MIRFIIVCTLILTTYATLVTDITSLPDSHEWSTPPVSRTDISYPTLFGHVEGLYNFKYKAVTGLVVNEVNSTLWSGATLYNHTYLTSKFNSKKALPLSGQVDISHINRFNGLLDRFIVQGYANSTIQTRKLALTYIMMTKQATSKKAVKYYKKQASKNMFEWGRLRKSGGVGSPYWTDMQLKKLYASVSNMKTQAHNYVQKVNSQTATAEQLYNTIQSEMAYLRENVPVSLELINLRGQRDTVKEQYDLAYSKLISDLEKRLTDKISTIELQINQEKDELAKKKQQWKTRKEQANKRLKSTKTAIETARSAHDARWTSKYDELRNDLETCCDNITVDAKEMTGDIVEAKMDFEKLYPLYMPYAADLRNAIFDEIENTLSSNTSLSPGGVDNACVIKQSRCDDFKARGIVLNKLLIKTSTATKALGMKAAQHTQLYNKNCLALAPCETTSAKPNSSPIEDAISTCQPLYKVRSTPSEFDTLVTNYWQWSIDCKTELENLDLLNDQRNDSSIINAFTNLTDNSNLAQIAESLAKIHQLNGQASDDLNIYMSRKMDLQNHLSTKMFELSQEYKDLVREKLSALNELQEVMFMQPDTNIKKMNTLQQLQDKQRFTRSLEGLTNFKPGSLMTAMDLLAVAALKGEALGEQITAQEESNIKDMYKQLNDLEHNIISKKHAIEKSMIQHKYATQSLTERAASAKTIIKEYGPALQLAKNAKDSLDSLSKSIISIQSLTSELNNYILVTMRNNYRVTSQKSMAIAVVNWAALYKCHLQIKSKMQSAAGYLLDTRRTAFSKLYE